MNDDAIRYAVLGLGRAGWNIHIHGLADRDDARVVAVADPLRARREEAAARFGCRTYRSLGPMLAQDDIDVVVVATPSHTHAADARRALKSGRHVVVEKPMAMSVAQADSVIATAQEADRRLFVHHNYRFMRNFTYYVDVIRSGLIGRVFHIRNTIVAFSRRYDWQTLAKNGGGVLNNTCPHFIDQAMCFMGAPVVQAMGDLQHIAAAGDVEDHVKALLRAANGCTADIEISSAVARADKAPLWVICGTHGTLTSDGQQATIRWFDPAAVQPVEAVDGPVMTRNYDVSKDLPWQTKTEEVKGPDVGNFYDNVRAVLRERAAMRVTPESAREVIRVIALIRRGTAFPGRPSRSKGT